VFVYRRGQVRAALEVTHRLGGQNYVLWGGREGYETLPYRHRARLRPARPLCLAGGRAQAQDRLQGPILIRTQNRKSRQAPVRLRRRTCYSFLQRYDLLKDVALTSSRTTPFSPAIRFSTRSRSPRRWHLGSLDINRGDDLLGWDTDQFAMNVPELALMFHELLKGGGFHHRRPHFDAKIRRQSIDPLDLIRAHVGSMDACARALLAAADMLDAGCSRRRSPSDMRGGPARRARHPRGAALARRLG